MTKYLKAELYRILKKKSLYILLLVVAVGYAALNYMILPSNATINDFFQPVGMLISLIPMVFGIYIFITVYNDDFNNNIINSSVGFGIKRYKLVIYKLIVSFILTLIIILVLAGVFFLVGSFYKFTYSNEIIKNLLLLTLGTIILIMGYISIASILLYTTRKSLYGIISYILLCTGTINMILSLVLGSKQVVNLIGDITDWMFTPLTNGIINGEYINLIGIAIYFVVSIILSIIMFKKLELEFN